MMLKLMYVLSTGYACCRLIIKVMKPAIMLVYAFIFCIIMSLICNSYLLFTRHASIISQPNFNLFHCTYYAFMRETDLITNLLYTLPKVICNDGWS